jgi:hypothetical protein
LEQTIVGKAYPLAMAVDADGVVTVRADDPAAAGTSVSSDVLVQKALAGEATVSVVAEEGVLVPELWLKAAAPVTVAGRTVGAVLLGRVADTAYVDGVKTTTGLDAALYAGNVLAATTYTTGEANRRWLGTTLTDQRVLDQVLNRGEAWVGGMTMMNVPFAGAFEPLKNAADVPVGMVWVGVPQVRFMETAAEAVTATFTWASILMVLSVIPAFFVARYIVYQVK